MGFGLARDPRGLPLPGFGFFVNLLLTSTAPRSGAVPARDRGDRRRCKGWGLKRCAPRSRRPCESRTTGPSTTTTLGFVRASSNTAKMQGGSRSKKKPGRYSTTRPRVAPVYWSSAVASSHFSAVTRCSGSFTFVVRQYAGSPGSATRCFTGNNAASGAHNLLGFIGFGMC